MQNAVLVVWGCRSAPTVKSYHRISLLRSRGLKYAGYGLPRQDSNVPLTCGRFIALIINGVLLRRWDWSWTEVDNKIVSVGGVVLEVVVMDLSMVVTLNIKNYLCIWLLKITHKHPLFEKKRNSETFLWACGTLHQRSIHSSNSNQAWTRPKLNP